MKKLLRLVSALLVIALTCTTLAVTSFADGNVAAVTIDGVTTEYATLKEAFAVLTSSTTATIDLLCDTSYSGTAALQFNGTVTLNLNGHTVTGTSTGAVFGTKASSTVTICNGTITGNSNSGVVAVNNKNTVVTLENLTLSNTSTSSSSLFAYSALQMAHTVSITVTATNCTFTSASSAGSAVSYSTSSSSRSASQTITLNDCTLTAPKYGIYIYGGHSSGYFNITLNDCEVTTTGTNSTAFYVKGQSKSYYAKFALTINDTDITSTNLLSNENAYIKDSSTVTVSGSSNLNVSSLDGKAALDYVTLTVTGGNSSVDVEEYVDTTSDSNLQYVETEGGAYVAGYSTTLEYKAEEGEAEEVGTVEGVESVIAPDSVVTFTVTCQIGYQVSKVAVYEIIGANVDMSEVTIIDNQDGTYSFTMPSDPVYVSVAFEKTVYQASESEVVEVENGSYTVQTTATYGETVTITTNPNKHYKVSEVVVIDDNTNEPIEVTYNELNGTYSFVMPAGMVSISVSYYQFSAEVSGIIYVDSEHHGMFINGHLATYPHTVDENGYCTVCKEYIGLATEETETPVEEETSTLTEETVNIEEPVEDTNTESEPDEEPEEIEVSETETNPTTGAVLMLLPMAMAVAGVVASKRR
ncbi:MAG: hypothetical protein LUG49_00715 [Oscillospiraceae bacterium]|nr:hypothetical protein [Oscillospiraceae bacterium]